MTKSEYGKRIGAIEIHTGNGVLEQCDLTKRAKLSKHDRFIDCDTIPVLETLTHAEIKILLFMFKISTMKNLVFEIKTDLTERTISSALKTLCDKNLIRKILFIKSVRKSIKGWMINPFHFRKTRQTEQYFSLKDLYDSFHEEEILVITMKEFDQVMQERIDLETTLMEN